MSTETERYNLAKETEAKLRNDLLSASGGIENTSSALASIADIDKKTWAKEAHDYMIENMHPEPIDIMEEKARVNVKPKIEANEPAPEPSLTSGQKDGALRSIGYAERNVSYIHSYVKSVPSMKEKASGLLGNLTTLKVAVEEDPPTSSRRHKPRPRSRSVGSRRGLTPRQRRRMRRES